MTHRGPFQPLLFCDSVNFHLSPDHCKKVEEWVITFFKSQNPVVSGSIHVNWNLTNNITPSPEWT